MGLEFRIRPPDLERKLGPKWPEQKFRKKDQGKIPILQTKAGENKA